MLKEPVVHFLILGLLIYGGYAWLHAGEDRDEGDVIHVGAGEIEWMRTSFSKRWRRQPTETEIDGMVQDYVRETALYREALAMGLDEDDTIVRRRLAQKLEFLVQDLAETNAPTEEDILAYFDGHRARYRRPERVTFVHVFVDPDRRGDATISDADALKEELLNADDPVRGSAKLGDPFMLQRYYPERTEAEVAKLFGGEFATQVAALPEGEWHGPMLSGYGVHLVYVLDRQQFPEPALSEVRGRVEEDFIADQRRRMHDEYVDRLIEKYDVVVEKPTSLDVGREQVSR